MPRESSTNETCPGAFCVGKLAVAAGRNYRVRVVPNDRSTACNVAATHPAFGEVGGTGIDLR